MTTDPLEDAVRTTREVLTTVQPDQLRLPTPCVSWTVADVINHLVNGHLSFATAVRGEDAPAEEVDAASGDFLAAYDDATARSVAAFGEEGAAERIVHLRFADLPVGVVIGIAATDTFAHGWDVARATGQPTDLDSTLAGALLTRVQPLLAPSLRGPDGQKAFGPEQQAPQGAPVADRLAAFLGRAVSSAGPVSRLAPRATPARARRAARPTPPP